MNAELRRGSYVKCCTFQGMGHVNPQLMLEARVQA
jgi:hypothetical protein